MNSYTADLLLLALAHAVLTAWSRPPTLRWPALPATSGTGIGRRQRTADSLEPGEPRPPAPARIGRRMVLVTLMPADIIELHISHCRSVAWSRRTASRNW